MKSVKSLFWPLPPIPHFRSSKLGGGRGSALVRENLVPSWETRTLRLTQKVAEWKPHKALSLRGGEGTDGTAIWSNSCPSQHVVQECEAKNGKRMKPLCRHYLIYHLEAFLSWKYKQDFYSAPPLLTTEHCCSSSCGDEFALLTTGSIVQGKQLQDRSAVALQTFLPC